MSTNSTGTAPTIVPTNATTVFASPPHDEGINIVEAEAGAIVGAIFGILVSAGFITVAGVLYIRRKRERDREYMRKAKVQRVSAESAGVYRDTTTESKYRQPSSSSRDSRNKGPEYSSLRKDPNMFEDDSEDEL